MTSELNEASLKDIFVFSLNYVCACEYVRVSASLCGGQRGYLIPGTGSIGDVELPDTDTGNNLGGLQGQYAFLTTEPSPVP